MWVKICGNTRLEDCMAAAELGADAVGFVFAEGKRTVSVEDVAAIVPHLPEGVEKIGVFSSVDAAEIIDAVQFAGLTGVQLHSGGDAALIWALRSALPETRVMPVVHWWVDRPAETQWEPFQDAARKAALQCSQILVDARTETASGGTGRAVDWRAARSALDGVEAELILAGGLTPDNVIEALAAMRPWGVDVSSGVETSPGVKDMVKLKRFIGQAKGRAV